VGHCRASATGTHLHHALARHIVEVTAKAFGKPQAIGVVADAPSLSTTVFTAPMPRASGDNSSSSGMIACLHG
jgi:hypothetical protein